MICDLRRDQKLGTAVNQHPATHHPLHACVITQFWMNLRTSTMFGFTLVTNSVEKDLGIIL